MSDQNQNEAGKQFAFNIELIRLVKCNVEMLNPKGKMEYGLRLINLAFKEADEGKSLTLHAGFDVMHGISDPLFSFTCDFVAKYTSVEPVPWNQLSTGVLIAHIVPYLREFVSNVTTRLPVPALLLDPVNAHNLVNDYKRLMDEASGVGTPTIIGTPPAASSK